MRNRWTVLWILALVLCLGACQQDHTHIYEEIVTPASCLEAGFTTMTCACGHSYPGRELPATGHKWGRWQVIQAGDCKQDEIRSRTCTGCQLQQRQTEETVGYHGYGKDGICSGCGDQVSMGLLYCLVPDGYTVAGIGACQDTDIIIPTHYEGKPVLGIEEYAFQGCENITSISIPETVERIAYGAFFGCRNLTKINIPKAVTQIPPYAFDKCEALETLELPENLVSIGTVAFRGCTSLREIKIPQSVTELGAYAFCQCTSLKQIEIPQGVRRLEPSLLESCTALESIYIPYGVVEIGEGALAGCSMLQSLDIPSSVIIIGESAFEGLLSVKRLRVPDSVVKIGAYAFAYCQSLEEIRLPRFLDEMEAGLLGWCLQLKRAEVPQQVRIIGDYAFQGCIALEELTLPGGVEKLGTGILFDTTQTVSIFYDGTMEQWKQTEGSGNIPWSMSTTGYIVYCQDGVLEYLEYEYVEVPLELDLTGLGN